MYTHLLIFFVLVCKCVLRLCLNCVTYSTCNAATPIISTVLVQENEINCKKSRAHNYPVVGIAVVTKKGKWVMLLAPLVIPWNSCISWKYQLYKLILTAVRYHFPLLAHRRGNTNEILGKWNCTCHMWYLSLQMSNMKRLLIVSLVKQPWTM